MKRANPKTTAAGPSKRQNLNALENVPANNPGTGEEIQETLTVDTDFLVKYPLAKKEAYSQFENTKEVLIIQLSGSEVTKLLSYFKGTKILTVTDTHIRNKSTSLPRSVEELKLVNVKIPKEVVLKLLRAVGNSLRSLHLKKIKWTDGTELELILEKHCPNLSSFVNCGGNVTIQFSKSTTAKYLLIDLNKRYRPEVLIALLKERKEKHIYLGVDKDRCAKYDAFWRAIGEQSHIQQLTIVGCSFVRGDYRDAADYSSKDDASDDFYDSDEGSEDESEYDYGYGYRYGHRMGKQCCCGDYHDDDDDQDQDQEDSTWYLAGKNLQKLTVDVFNNHVAENINGVFFRQLEELEITEYFHTQMENNALVGLCSLAKLRRLEISAKNLILTQSQVLVIIDSLQNFKELHLVRFTTTPEFKEKVVAILNGRGQQLRMIYTTRNEGPPPPATDVIFVFE